MKHSPVIRNCFYLAALILIFAALTVLMIPEDCVFGSHMDWLSQHAALAETIRDACLEQHTLLPDWLSLGGGVNGYQFSYYGFLRPDILIGCLFPQIPMVWVLIGYMLSVGLSSVLLCFFWLKSEELSSVFAFAGSILFLTAGCLFHLHRQVMFVNYLPFLLLSFLSIRKKQTKWLPLCLCLIWLNSFYYVLSILLAIGWYWYQTEGREFLKVSFLKGYIPSVLLSAAMAGALLIPTGLVLLEHRRGGSIPSLRELFLPDLSFQSILFSPYAMGLTLVCLYALLAGLFRKSFRRDSIFLLFLCLFRVFTWVLNATLYTRAKILIPFMPLVILHCVRFFQKEWKRLPLPPFVLLVPVSLLWYGRAQFPWIMAELCLLLLLCLGTRTVSGKRPEKTPKALQNLKIAGTASVLLLLICPVGICLTTAQTEDWVMRDEISPGFSAEENFDISSRISFAPLYRFDSLAKSLETSNRFTVSGQHKSSMYSSVTSHSYSEFYYDRLRTPVRINNRIALLDSSNPFLLYLMGIRYVETTKDFIPAGYQPLYQSGENVIAENTGVLPVAYFTDTFLSQEEYDSLTDDGKLDALVRNTIVDTGNSTNSSGDPDGQKLSENRDTQYVSPYGIPAFEPVLSTDVLPEGLSIRKTKNGYEIHAEQDCQMSVKISAPVPDHVLLLQFSVRSQNGEAVVIDINGIRNKLSGSSAPYPNGNDCFHYQFAPDQGEDVNELKVTFSKGSYTVSGVQWSLYDMTRFSEKEYTPLKKDSSLFSDSRKGGTQVLSGTVTADRDGVFATSIPLQKGMELLIDGKPAELITVNEAFAGALMKQGMHTVELRFSPPGKTAGCILSLTSAAGYGLFLIWSLLRFWKRGRELTAYLVSGCITTGVNYCLYTVLLSSGFHWGAANSIAWAAAVVTAYLLNRKLVFASEDSIVREFLSFAGLRLATLLAENILLGLLISLAAFPPFPAKLLVSIVTVAGNYIFCKFGVFKKKEENRNG